MQHYALFFFCRIVPADNAVDGVFPSAVRLVSVLRLQTSRTSDRQGQRYDVSPIITIFANIISISASSLASGV